MTRARSRKALPKRRSHGGAQTRLGPWSARPGALFASLFAGGGGTSEGSKAATGEDPDVAVNHSDIALAMHAANHPTTVHYRESVYSVDPIAIAGGRPFWGVWASPDCTHHSKAKGGKPRSKKIRGLAWVLARWAKLVRPRVLFLENVEEFADWGPLGSDGTPIKARAGETFRAFVRKLESYGYSVEWRTLVAADYGAPTTRRRLFLIARCDGEPIVWPEPTHAKDPGPGQKPWRTAREVIDWSLPVRSIFGRKKPLAEATMRRIAAGLVRFVLESAQPFIVPVTHPRDRRVHSLDEPVRTITGANRGEFALVVPTLVTTGHGERTGQAPRAPGLDKPLGTVVATAENHALVAAFLTKHYGSPPHRMRAIGSSLEEPVSTVTAQDHNALSAAWLMRYNGEGVGADAREPVPTVTARDRFAEVRAFLRRYAGEDVEPIVTIGGEQYVIADIGMRMLSPRELFRAQGFPDEYVIDPFVWKTVRGRRVRVRLNRGEQIFCAGNAVPPPVAKALVRANMPRRIAEAA